MLIRAVVLCGIAGLLACVPVRGEDLGERRWALAEMLRKSIEFQGFDDVKTPLQEALDRVERRYDTPFRVNERAFRDDGVMDVMRTEIASPIPIPPMPAASYQTVLQVVLDRIPAPSGATFLIRDDCIEITTNAAARAEIWGKDFKGPFQPLVHVRARSQPVSEVLASLADRTPLNVVIDPRTKEAAATEVTVRLLNTPADTALDLLADMAGLKVVQLRNVYYVTTSEHAAELRKGPGQKQGPSVPGRPSRPFPGPGPGSGPGPGPNFSK